VEVIQESRTYLTIGQVEVEGESAGNLSFATAEGLHRLDGKVSSRERERNHTEWEPRGCRSDTVFMEDSGVEPNSVAEQPSHPMY
jgi:hypothetical protein